MSMPASLPLLTLVLQGPFLKDSLRRKAEWRERGWEWIPPPLLPVQQEALGDEESSGGSSAGTEGSPALPSATRSVGPRDDTGSQSPRASSSWR